MTLVGLQPSVTRRRGFGGVEWQDDRVGAGLDKVGTEWTGEVAAAAYYDQAGRVRADSWIPPNNLACLRATNGAPAEALALLGEAAERGLAAQELLDHNDDLDAVRTLAGWPALVERVQTAAAMAAKAERGGS